MADEPAMTAGRRKSVARATKKKATKPALHYTVSMPDPASHTFHVEIKLSGTGEFCVLAFPAWTPGSYKIREFGKNVSGFKAKGAKFEMLDKQRYRISGDCTVSFDYYADGAPKVDEGALARVEGGDGGGALVCHVSVPSGVRSGRQPPRRRLRARVPER